MLLTTLEDKDEGATLLDEQDDDGKGGVNAGYWNSLTGERLEGP